MFLLSKFAFKEFLFLDAAFALEDASLVYFGWLSVLFHGILRLLHSGLRRFVVGGFGSISVVPILETVVVLIILRLVICNLIHRVFQQARAPTLPESLPLQEVHSPLFVLLQVEAHANR